MDMKKMIVILLSVLMLLSLTACGSKKASKEWDRVGYFTDADENLVTIMKSDMEDYPGWYVGCVFGEEMYGWFIPQEGNTLHGNLVPDYEEGEYVVTVSEEGEDGILFKVKGGASYHLVKTEIEEAAIAVTINTEGVGAFTAVSNAEGAFNAEDPVTFVILSLYEPTTYKLTAIEIEDWKFIKWTRNGIDYSPDMEITVRFDEDADFIAIFEYKED